MAFRQRLSTPRVAGSSPAGTANFPSQKVKRCKGFAGFVELALYTFWVERKRIKTDKSGHKGTRSPGLIPGLIPHSETERFLAYHRHPAGAWDQRALGRAVLDQALVLAMVWLLLAAAAECWS